MIVPERSKQTFETIPIHPEFPDISKIHKEKKIFASQKLRHRKKLPELRWMEVLCGKPSFVTA